MTIPWPSETEIFVLAEPLIKAAEAYKPRPLKTNLKQTCWFAFLQITNIVKYFFRFANIIIII
jgi:hypothetical protein